MALSSSNDSKVCSADKYWGDDSVLLYSGGSNVWCSLGAVNN